jgi:hypothetical protein
MLFVGNLSRVVLDCKCAGSVGKKFHSEAEMHCGLATRRADADLTAGLATSFNEI